MRKFLLILSFSFLVFAGPVLAAADMVLIPGGSFAMGSSDRVPDERPVHKVSVKTFYLDRTEVTNLQMAAYLNKHGHAGPKGERFFDLGDSDARIKRLKSGEYIPFPGHEKMPVVEVSWLGARDYCARLGKRLPTEAEWEFAARGREGRLYPWGNHKPERTRAHYGHEWGDFAEVGSHPRGATPEGVLGLAGNVHEWTSSTSDNYPYRADDGRETQDFVPDRVTRGGSH